MWLLTCRVYSAVRKVWRDGESVNCAWLTLISECCLFSYTISSVTEWRFQGARHRRSSRMLVREWRVHAASTPVLRTQPERWRWTCANTGRWTGWSSRRHKRGEWCEHGGDWLCHWICTSPALSLTRSWRFITAVSVAYDAPGNYKPRLREVCGIWVRVTMSS